MKTKQEQVTEFVFEHFGKIELTMQTYSGGSGGNLKIKSYCLRIKDMLIYKAYLGEIHFNGDTEEELWNRAFEFFYRKI